MSRSNERKGTGGRDCMNPPEGRGTVRKAAVVARRSESGGSDWRWGGEEVCGNF